MKQSYLYFIILIITISSPAIGQRNWEFRGQIRQRFESDRKDFNSETGSNNFNLLRSRLGVFFTPDENLSAFMQVQDSRMFGEERNTLTDGNADQLDLHQAYFEIDSLFKLPVALKIGRMEVNYGPQRLIGAVGWHNIGRSFDGAILKLQARNATIDFFNFKEVERAELDNAGDRNVFGAYADLDLYHSLESQAFFIWQRRKPSTTLNRYTFGFYLNGYFGPLSHEIEFAYQSGKVNDLDVSAVMAAINIGYKLKNVKSKPGFSVGIDYLSGDDNPADGNFNVFDTMYATNHKYYGHMDYFLNIPAHTFGLGLRDMHAKLSAIPISNTTALLAFHLFKSNDHFLLENGEKATGFGKEINLSINHNYSQNITFFAGISFFFADDIFKRTKGNDTANWFYLMTTVNL